MYHNHYHDRATENLEEIKPQIIPEATKIFVNGNWVGVHREPNELVKTLRSLRRCVDIDAEVSVIRDLLHKELRIYTDAGIVFFYNLHKSINRLI
jgi:DNA-directed RNA polymerase II subunit RPB2